MISQDHPCYKDDFLKKENFFNGRSHLGTSKKTLKRDELSVYSSIFRKDYYLLDKID